jgi:ATP-dependent DNA helicase RecG
MVDTSDGFRIAEVDLKLRGPGDLMGTQQSGVLQMKIADIVKDQGILEAARKAAFEVASAEGGSSNAVYSEIWDSYQMITRNKSLWSKIS